MPPLQQVETPPQLDGRDFQKQFAQLSSKCLAENLFSPPLHIIRQPLGM